MDEPKPDKKEKKSKKEKKEATADSTKGDDRSDKSNASSKADGAAAWDPLSQLTDDAQKQAFTEVRESLQEAAAPRAVQSCRPM